MTDDIFDYEAVSKKIKLIQEHLKNREPIHDIETEYALSQSAHWIIEAFKAGQKAGKSAKYLNALRDAIFHVSQASLDYYDS